MNVHLHNLISSREQNEKETTDETEASLTGEHEEFDLAPIQSWFDPF